MGVQPLDLIGNTPLIRWGEFEGSTIWIKDEGRNLTGSLKDRHARVIVEHMDARGELEGKELLDASSGSYAVALVQQAVLRGLPATVVVNEKISQTNLTFIRSLEERGITVIRHGKVTGEGYLYCRELIKKEPERYAFTDQLNNPDVAKAHEPTAAEIMRDLPDVAAIVASIGSGATLLGIHRYLAGAGHKVALFGAVGIPGDEAKLAGTFVEGTDYSTPFIEEIAQRGLAVRVPVRYREGFDAVMRHLVPRGIYAGPQGGGVFVAAMAAVKKYGLCGNIVAIAGDSYYKNADRFVKA